jgi:hypothetical protein
MSERLSFWKRDVAMIVTYDAEVDALYIRFLESTVTTEHLAEEMLPTTTPKDIWPGLRFLTRSNALAAKMCFAA